MSTGQELVLDLEEQMNTIKLPLMALKLDELFRSPDFTAMDKLDFLSALLTPEFRDKVSKTTNNRLRTAHLIGSPCEISSCVDSSIRRYEPAGTTEVLSSLLSYVVISEVSEVVASVSAVVTTSVVSVAVSSESSLAQPTKHILIHRRPMITLFFMIPPPNHSYNCSLISLIL